MMKTLEDVHKELVKIKAMDFVTTHRAHDTGIGKTLEDLLGLKENNLKLPDIGDIELKAKRIDSGSMLTLATKSPNPKGTNRLLFEAYKYKDNLGEYGLHTTVDGSKPNNLGFQSIFKDNKLYLSNKGNIEAYWPITVFDDVLKAKSNKILLVFAETKGERKTATEQFHYIEAFLLSELSIAKFKTAILNDRLKVDIRIGVYRSGSSKGKYHDHGTGFRINKTYFLELFDNYKQIL